MLQTSCHPTPPLIPFMATLPLQGGLRKNSLVYRPDQRLDLVGMRSKFLGELVEIGIGDLLKAGLVHVGDDLHAYLLKLGRRRTLQFECAFGFLQADVSRSRQHPAPLLRIEALPQLVADPE